jgi:hypothetical protein
MLNNQFVPCLQQYFWTTWTTWTRSKSVKKNIFFVIIYIKGSKLFSYILVKPKKYKKIIFFLSDFHVVHLVHLVQKSILFKEGELTNDYQ